jgi:hypothetical protein
MRERKLEGKKKERKKERKKQNDPTKSKIHEYSPLEILALAGNSIRS